MIFLQGLISEPGVAVDCFELFENEIIELFVSEDVLAEIQDVITRPKLQAKYSRLTGERAEKLVEILRTKATLVKDVPTVFNYPRNPKDEMTGFDDDSKEFRHKFRPLKIIQPLEFMKIIEEKTKEF